MRRAWLFFLWLCFAALYLLSMGRGFYSSDGDVMFKTTAALVERHTFTLPPDPGLPQIVRGHGDSYYSKYDPGLPLIGVPFYAAGNWIGRINHAHRTHLAAIAMLTIPALAAATATTGLAALSAPLTHSTRRALTVALVAGLATPLWPYARTLFAESLLACALTCSVLLIGRTARLTPGPSGPASPPQRRGVADPVRDGGEADRRVFLAGILFGIGLLTRAALAVYAPALVLLIVRFSPPRRALRHLITFGVGTLPFVLGLLWHNNLRFGDPLRFGYAGEGFSTLPWTGIAGLLVGPGKSVFLFAPPLILAVMLWPRFRRANAALADFLALAGGTALVVYGSWWAWGGGWSWGPRFLVPLMPLSCLPLIALPDTRGWRRMVIALVMLGFAVQCFAVLTDVTPHYAAESRNEFAPGDSALISAIRRISEGKTEPLALFHLRDTGLPPTWTVGVPLLLVLTLIASGGMLARAWRTIQEKYPSPRA